jgi:dolichol-phosphate mannosyltransferase
MKVLVVVPTYNEAENLPAIVAELIALDITGLELLVVDDASPDNTGKVAEELAKRYPGLIHVMHRAGKLGLGTAYIQGFQWAIDNGYDYVIQMDADFSHSPTYIPRLLELIQHHDVVIGSRYVKGGQLDERWGWGRWFLSWWANSVWVRLILGMRTKDATAGFKCWRSEALQRVGLDRIRSNGYVFQVEMMYVAEKVGLDTYETPIYFEDRRIGQSKMSIPVKLEAAIRVFEIGMRHRNAQPAPTPSNDNS